MCNARSTLNVEATEALANGGGIVKFGEKAGAPRFRAGTRRAVLALPTLSRGDGGEQQFDIVTAFNALHDEAESMLAKRGSAASTCSNSTTTP